MRSLEKARERAIEIERGFAYRGENEENSRREKTQIKLKETRRINVIETASETKCNFCNEAGHAAMYCPKFCLQLNNPRRDKTPLIITFRQITEPVLKTTINRPTIVIIIL